MSSRRWSGKSAHGFIMASSVPHHLGEVMAAREALVEDDESTIAALAAKAAAKKAAAKAAKKAELEQQRANNKAKAIAASKRRAHELKKLERATAQAAQALQKRLVTHGGALSKTAKVVTNYLAAAEAANTSARLAEATEEIRKASWADLASLPPKARSAAKKDAQKIEAAAHQLGIG